MSLEKNSVEIAGFMQHLEKKMAAVKQYVVGTDEIIIFILRIQRMSKSEFSTAKLPIHQYILYYKLKVIDAF